MPEHGLQGALAILDKLIAEHEWQPIATAPANTPILICWAVNGEYQDGIELATYAPSANARHRWLNQNSGNYISPSHAPTHWMSRPAPPITITRDEKSWAIDESKIVTETYQIPNGFMPKGNWWDEDGACYSAGHCDTASDGLSWRWAARNAKALAKGYRGQKLFPFVLTKGVA